MTRNINDDVFKLKPKTPHSRADITDSTVREILREEADALTSLTRKLREARLARDAAAPEPEPVKRRPVRKTRPRTV